MTGRRMGDGVAVTVAALALLAAVAVWQLAQSVRESGLAAIEALGVQRLELYAGTLSTAVDKYAFLPTILTRDGDIRALLASPADPRLVERVNRKLHVTNGDAGSAALYLLDPAGSTLAASNWAEATSFVGHAYGFRPYFLQALSGGNGRWFGIGVTTQMPGYFIARAATAGERILGVAVVKIDLEPLQSEWSRGGEWVMVTDANQVAVLASRPDWKYGTLADPSPQLAAELAATQQYAATPLHRLDFREIERRSPDSVVVRIGGRPMLMQSRRLGENGWTIRYVSDLAPVEARRRDSALMAAAASLAVSLLVLYLRQRRLRQKAEMDARAAVAETLRRARDELERKVEERTADLRATQEELIHAGKMAALGQMSAALAHEVNQPLAAIQTFVASTRVFAERGDVATVNANLTMIDDLTRRMAELTGHLKTFARKTPGRREPVDIGQALDRALMLVDSALRPEGIELERDAAADCLILGDAIRLEQVLVNLLRNAIDAMRGAPVRRLSVAVADCGTDWAIRIGDTGPGIAAGDLDRLFDPFFTTKEVGQGLGLGLSLSYGIVRDFGGSIRAETPSGGGATFVVQLPKAPSESSPRHA